MDSNKRVFKKTRGDTNDDKRDDRLEEKVIEIKRVSKKTKGGNRVAFSAMVAVGDNNGKIGIGLAKAPDVSSAINKATIKAKKKMITFKLNNKTISHHVMVKQGSCKVFLKPVPKGSGLIAGGAVRKVLELAGVRDISAKVMGANNKTLNVYATIEALSKLKN